MPQNSRKQELANQSRRNFLQATLKATAYTSALSIGGISSLAFAMKSDKPISGGKTSTISNGDISVMQQKMLHKETVSLINNSDKAITLDALHPVTIERFNGSLIVKPNLIQSEAFSGMIMMHPGQRISFDIQTTGGVFSSAEIADVSKLSGQHLHITSEHASFNKLIPVTSPEFKEAIPTMPTMAFA